MSVELAPLLLPSAHGPAAPAAVWRVRLLGGFEIENGRQRLTRLRSCAAMALLARLALSPQRAHSREELAALLWPDADAVSGRNRLRQTPSLPKAVLEPAGATPVIDADRRVLRVAAGALWCDVVAFEQALRAGHGAQALALYPGELMPGFYDEWVLDERRRLQALAERVPTAPAAPAMARTTAPGLRLPQYLTRLIGADVQGARLRALVAAQRLVTVLGPGGSGKTRLPVEVARLLSEPGPDAAAPRFAPALFVSLVGAVTRTELLDRLALALRASAGCDALEAVLTLLDGRSALLLLDNAEQLDDDALATVAHLAERLASAHWLVTSRRPTGLDGERRFYLGALELPAVDAPLDEVVMNPAVALFADRARAQRAEFHVGEPQREAMVALVRWLDGLPLAIELAASHAHTLEPAELLRLLQTARHERASLAFLARRGARSGSDPRHASMLEVVAWSWRLLSPASQRLLLALCLLPAGATLEAAAALAAAPGRPPALAAAQMLLDELRAHSVLRAGAGQDGRRRHTALEPVREYVLGQHDDTLLRPWRRRVLDGLLDWAGASTRTMSAPAPSPPRRCRWRARPAAPTPRPPCSACSATWQRWSTAMPTPAARCRRRRWRCGRDRATATSSTPAATTSPRRRWRPATRLTRWPSSRPWRPRAGSCRTGTWPPARSRRVARRC